MRMCLCGIHADNSPKIMLEIFEIATIDTQWGPYSG